MGTEVDVVILPPSAPAFYDDASVTDIPPDVASVVIRVKNTLNKSECVQTLVLVDEPTDHHRTSHSR